MSPATERRSVILVRHGRTAGNAGGLIMGRTDLPLDDVGQAQVQALAAALGTLSVDAVYTSPLLRAQQTASAIASACAAALHVCAELLELDFGSAATAAIPPSPGGADGGARRPRLEVKTRHRYEPLPGGESLHDVWMRLEQLAPRLRAGIDRGQRIVVVGHYRANQLLEGMLLGRSFESAVRDSTYKPENASAHEVDLSSGATIALWPPR